MQSQLKNKGEKAEQPETPVRSGYVFDGWFSTDDFSDEFDFETVLDEDVVLYAKWIKQYNVVFNTMGGSEVETVLITEGALLEAPQTLPAKDGYNFSGWYTDIACSNAYGFSTPVNSDMTLYAGWSQKVYFSVQFFAGKYDENSQWQPFGDIVWVEEGAAVQKPETPDTIVDGALHKQWVFSEWDKSIDSVNENLKVYAIYTEEDEPTRYVLGGWGTADDPYILSDALDLQVFIQSLNEGWENAANIRVFFFGARKEIRAFLRLCQIFEGSKLRIA